MSADVGAAGGRVTGRTDGGTAGADVAPWPSISETQLAAQELREDIGVSRSQARWTSQEFDDLHKRGHFVEWTSRTMSRGKSSTADMLADLADLGFAWRDIANLIGVSVAALQKWRRGESASGENRRRVASLLAACDLIMEDYEVADIASWFEMPLLAGVPVTPIQLYAAERADLLFDYASGHGDVEQILNSFEPDWRESYRTGFEVYRAVDGELSVRPKDE